jgi:hypothetical protein
VDDRRQPSENYDPPRLTELGSFVSVTQANGLHVGKMEGGPDAFGLVGQGHLTQTSA